MSLYRPTSNRNFVDIDFKCKEGQVIELKDSRAAEVNAIVPGLLELFDAAKHMPPVYDSMIRRMYDPVKREHFGPEMDEPKKEIVE